MAKRELMKIVAQAVVIERDDSGAIVGELTSEPRTCFGLDDLAAVHAQAVAVVQEFNAQEEAQQPPNRAQRRASGKGKP